MTQENKLVNVYLPLSIPIDLVYFAPTDVKHGSFVEVPLGASKKVIGVVWGDYDSNSNSNSNIDKLKVKNIIRVLPATPLASNLRQFIDWVAKYTMSHTGSVLKMAMSCLPALEEAKKIKVYKLGEIRNLRITDSRARVLDILQDDNILTKSQIEEKAQVSSAVIKSMKDAGAVVEFMVDGKDIDSCNKDLIAFKGDIADVDLSQTQEEAASFLRNTVKSEEYSVSLIDGVTGSGKTEVYFSAIEEALKIEDAQVVIMLPEIILTTQIVARFKRRFGFDPLQWHSNLTSSQREKNWRAISDGSAKLIVGARSALFLPYKNLKLIVIDEEHDSSFKQEEGVIYHARDMAVVRCNIEKIPLILVSATPSIETMANVKSGKYKHLQLPSRHGDAVMPDIKIVDLRKEKLATGSWISPTLRKAIEENIENSKQSMLFLNRRGYAPLKLCRNCGYRFQCPSCSSWMVEHKKHNCMICHHCDYRQSLPNNCPECEKEDMLVSCGPGVERLAEEVEASFPEARISLMTSDAMTTAAKAIEQVKKIEKGEVDIIIGTQVIAKGHHFPNLTLVGIVDADLGMEGGDLRAAERTYQLLHQVSGRAGREKDKGVVIMQSCMPDNLVMQALASGGRDEFIFSEVESRKKTNMPPYTRLAAIIVSDKIDVNALRAAKVIVSTAPKNDKIQVLGPVPAPLFLLRGSYRYRILIRAERVINIQKWLKQLISSIKFKNTTKVKIDIDPYNFM